MTDKTIRCGECGRDFAWRGGERRYHRNRDLSRPFRCPDCRPLRRTDLRLSTDSRTRASRKLAAGSGGASWFSSATNRFSVLTFALATLLAVGIDAFVTSLDFVASWLMAVNLVTFFSYAYDKAIAGTRRTRVPEQVLLVLALTGGTVGAIAGISAQRHKIRKRSFISKLLGVVVLQVSLIATYYLLLKPLLMS